MFFLISCQSQVVKELENNDENESSLENVTEENAEIIVGAEQIELFLPFIKDKNIGLVANQTSRVGENHLVDTLLSLGINIKSVFSPEHGFRGEADAGEKVSSGKDEKTGLSLISLYGKNKKPSADQLEDIDIIIFDIQDVGARFYTYISTLHYVMEACAEEGVTVLVLDRPNPNGHYVDGPVLDTSFRSFVGMHPVPIVHGMTIAEYAKMINGQGWLKNQIQCKLKLISCLNYNLNLFYSLPVPPSPNLRSDAAIALYPSLCLFEGTIVSEGRGTDFPFEVFGHPDLPKERYDFSFTPSSSYGAKHPKLKGELCHGLQLTEIGNKQLENINLSWLMESYNNLSTKNFFITKNRWFDLLAGTDQLRKSIEAGKTEKQIRDSWKADLEKFTEIRRKYLIY